MSRYATARAGGWLSAPRGPLTFRPRCPRLDGARGCGCNRPGVSGRSIEAQGGLAYRGPTFRSMCERITTHLAPGFGVALGGQRSGGAGGSVDGVLSRPHVRSRGALSGGEHPRTGPLGESTGLERGEASRADRSATVPLPPLLVGPAGVEHTGRVRADGRLRVEVSRRAVCAALDSRHPAGECVGGPTKGRGAVQREKSLLIPCADTVVGARGRAGGQER